MSSCNWGTSSVEVVIVINCTTKRVLAASLARHVATPAVSIPKLTRYVDASRSVGHVTDVVLIPAQFIKIGGVRLLHWRGSGSILVVTEHRPGNPLIVYVYFGLHQHHTLYGEVYNFTVTILTVFPVAVSWTGNGIHSWGFDHVLQGKKKKKLCLTFFLS